MKKKSLIIWAIVTVIFAVGIGSAQAEDPDYGNDPNTAEPIDPNGTVVEGILSSTGDQDWFSFSAVADGLYRISLWSQSGGKWIYVYGLNEFDQLTQITAFSANSGTTNKDIFIEQRFAGTCYLKVYAGSGIYQVSVLPPEPRCGDLNHPYPPGDANRDCVVNFFDVAILANSWLEDNRP